MENHNTEPGLGLVYSLISVICAFFAYITLKDVQVIFTIIAASVATVSGVIAAIHSYIGIKVKLKELRKYKKS